MAESSALRRLKEIQQRILETTPALQDPKRKAKDPWKESRPATSNSTGKRRDIPAEVLEELSRLEDLKKKINAETEGIRQKERDIKAREDRYRRRENEYRKILTDYEAELRARSNYERLGVDQQCDRNNQKLSKLHSEVNSNITSIQKKTGHILEEQERDIQRQFQSRMKEIDRELDEERKRKLQGAGNFAEAESKLTRELELMKASMDLIQSKNEQLRRENALLKQEYDQKLKVKDEVVQRVVTLKRENASLEADTDRILPPPPESDRSTQSARLHAASTAMLSPQPERYESIVTRLKHMVEVERRNLKSVRAAYARELQSKTELEQIIKQCSEEVKSQNIRRTGFKGKDAPFTPQDREKVVEMVLSQDRVLTLLYEKSFPTTHQRMGFA